MQKRDKIYTLFFVLALTILLIYFFYITAFAYPHIYVSDLNQHVRVAQLLFNPEFYTMNYLPHVQGYLMFHIVVKFISLITLKNYELASAIVLASSIILSLATLLYINRRMTRSRIDFWKIFIFALLFFIVGFPLTGNYYLPQGTPNPWHNPTLLFSRPFAIISFYSFYVLFYELKSYNFKTKWLYIFMISTFISCYCKPSFVFVFLPVAGILTIIRIIKTKFRYFWQSMFLLFAVLPTLLLLIYQYTLTFSSNLTMIIKFGSFMNLDLMGVLISTISILILPISYVILFKNEIIFKKFINISFWVFVVGWLQYYFMDTLEVSYGDFAWGYFISIFILYWAILNDYLSIKKSKNKDIFIYIYLAASIIGFIYFINQLMLRGFML